MKSDSPALRHLVPLVLLGWITTAMAAPGQATGIDPAASALAKAVTAKLGSAQTIRLTAKHKLDPGWGSAQSWKEAPSGSPSNDRISLCRATSRQRDSGDCL